VVFELGAHGADDFFAAVLALQAPDQHSPTILLEVDETYDRGRLGRLDGRTVRAHGGASASCVALLVFAGALRSVSVEGVRGLLRAYAVFLGDRHGGLRWVGVWWCLVG
jgi:hypothetical protein